MHEGGFGATAEDLDAIEREVVACRDELRDLESRARVMELESRAWKSLSVSGDRPDGGALIGFFCGLFGMAGLGALIRGLLALLMR